MIYNTVDDMFNADVNNMILITSAEEKNNIQGYYTVPGVDWFTF
jgi:hypothetical protein